MAGPPQSASRWPIGGREEVDWIRTGTAGIGRTIATAVPPVFESYATVVVAEEDEEMRVADAALLEVLRRHTPAQPWWLGLLEDGVSDLVVPDAARVVLYADWAYVLLQAGPAEAATWRATAAARWRGSLPELIFPDDRSWLVSTLWDDDWRCVGGSRALIADLLDHPALEAREVTVDEDAAPPGHQAR